MQKKVVTLAVLGAFVSCSALAQGAAVEPGQIQNLDKDRTEQIRGGEWNLTVPMVTVKTTKVDESIVNATIHLGESGRLTMDATETTLNLTWSQLNNSKIDGGADSVLTLNSDMNAVIGSCLEGPTLTDINVGTLNITNAKAGAVYVSGEDQVVKIKANDITMSGNSQPELKKVVFANGGGSILITDFMNMTVNSNAATALSVGPSGELLQVSSDKVGSHLTLNSNSDRATLDVYTPDTKENHQAKMLLKASTIEINQQGLGEAINVHSKANLDLTAQTLKVNGLVKIEDGAKINLAFTGADSVLNGNATVLGETAGLTFADGAVWNVPAKQQKFALFAAAEPVADSQVSNLTLNGGLVNVAAGTNVHADSLTVQNAGSVTLADGSSLSTDNLTGQAQVNLVLADPKTAPTGQFEAVKANEGAAVQVGFVNENNQTLTADEVSLDMATKAQSQVKGVENTQVKVQEGKVNGAVTVGPKGEATVERNTLLDSTMQIASASTLSLNRIVMNDVRKRMGDLRASDKQSGVWARYDGGRLSGEQSLETKFSTFQAGIDTVPGENTRFGLAFSYTDGDTDFARGSNDMKGYSLAGYGTWFNQNGLFADVVARMAVMDSTMAVEGESAELDNVALSLSGEAGWRLNLTDMAYVEPQAELTYTYVDGENFDLGSTHFSMNDTHSLLARAGIAAGLKCPADKGDVYVRVSAVHEFLGDGKIMASNGTVSNLQEIDGKDTWVEFGVGGNFNINDSTYVWADVERTQGATIEEDWRATVGVRYSF